MTHTIVPHHYCSKHISQWIAFRIFVTTKGHISCISNRCILVQLCVFSLSLHRCCNSINLKAIWTLCPLPTKTYNDYIIIIQDTCNVKTQGKNSDRKTRTYQREKNEQEANPFRHNNHSDQCGGSMVFERKQCKHATQIYKSVILVHFTIWPKIVICETVIARNRKKVCLIRIAWIRCKVLWYSFSLF